jgi:hypothetical protein
VHGAYPGEELLDLVENGVLIPCPRVLVDPRKLNVLRVGDLLGEIPAMIDAPHAIARAVDHEAGDADRRQDVPYIPAETVEHQTPNHARARCVTEQSTELLLFRFVVR